MDRKCMLSCFLSKNHTRSTTSLNDTDNVALSLSFCRVSLRSVIEGGAGQMRGVGQY